MQLVNRFKNPIVVQIGSYQSHDIRDIDAVLRIHLWKTWALDRCSIYDSESHTSR